MRQAGARHAVVKYSGRPRRAAAGTVAGMLALLASAPAAAFTSATAASCATSQKEFALLASMGMRDEAVKSWQSLPEPCRKALEQTGHAPSANAAPDAIVHYGEQLHALQKADHRSRLQQPLATVEVPQIDHSALAGLGPENLSRAVGGMLLDLTAAGLSSRHRHSQADAARSLSDLVRADENPWWRDRRPVSGQGNGGQGMAGQEDTESGIALQGQIPVPNVSRIPVPAAVSTASCQGNLEFLAPSLHPYPDPTLSQARSEFLAARIPDLIQGVRRQAADKNQVLRRLNETVAAIDTAAAKAKEQADDSDGRGDQVGTREVENDALSFDLQCLPEPSVHVTGLCEYINQRWTSLVYRTLIELYKRC